MQPGVCNGAYRCFKVWRIAYLVPVLIRVVMAPLVVILLFSTSRFRELAIPLVVLGHVLVIHLVFVLVPLVVVTSVSIVVPLGPVIRVVVVVSFRSNRPSKRCAHEKYGQISMHVVLTP